MHTLVNKPISETKATEDKTKISTPMLSGSVKNVASFGSLDAIAFPKTSGGGFSAYSSTSVPGGLILDHQKGGFNLRRCMKSIHSMLVVSYR